MKRMKRNIAVISLAVCLGIVFPFGKQISMAYFGEVFVKKPGAVSYNLKRPEETHELPKILKEVSGVTDVNNNEVGCVQDEKGIVFVYDLKNKKIVREILFGRDADYEGITYAKGSFYVMRSNGIIHQINLPWEKPIVKTSSLHLPTWNNEGLCFDKRNNRLLIAPKSKLKKGEKKDDEVIPIYSFDMDTQNLVLKPLFNIKAADIRDYAKKYDLPIPQTKKGKKKIKFRPSSIAIHPITDEIYILSSKGNLLVVFDKLGNIKGYEHLDKDIFNHPEGLTFLENGNMVITNEGDKKKPTLLVFQWYKR